MVSTRTRLASLYFRELGPRDGQALIHPICWGDSEPGGRDGRSGQVLRSARGAGPHTRGSSDSAALCWGPEEEGGGGQGEDAFLFAGQHQGWARPDLTLGKPQ